MSDKLAPRSPILSQAAIHAQPKLLLRPQVIDKNTSENMPIAVQVKTEVVTSVQKQDATMDFSVAELRERAHQEGFSVGLDEGREKGLRAGHEEGLAQGFQEGLKQGQEQAEESAQLEIETIREALHVKERQLVHMLKLIPEEFARRFAASEDDMVALVQESVLRILGQAFASGDGARLALRQAMTEIQSRQSISIRVHPDDLVLLTNEADVSSLKDVGVSWEADKQIVLGGCFIDTRDGTLDVRLETQLAAFTQLLLRVREQNHAKRSVDSV